MAKSIYKYLNGEGLKATLKNGNILFSKPSVFNDPFDTLLEDLFAYDPLNSTEEHIKPFSKLMRQDNFPHTSKLNEMGVVMKLLFDGFSKSKKDVIELEKELLSNSQDLFDIEKLRTSNQLVLDFTKKQFEKTGIFCGSKRPNNLLLWAHYADKHTGGVIKFKPSVGKDSMLITARDVIYTENRQFLYQTHDDFVEKSILDDIEKARFFSEKVTLTKGLDWKYEEELRVPVPNLMDHGDRVFLTYYDEEVEEVYIGHRTSDDTCSEIIELARNRNPTVKIFKMNTCKNTYNVIPTELL